MNKYIKPISCTFISILITSVIITIFNYFDILNGVTLYIFKLISLFMSISIGGFILGLNTIEKGYKYGFYYSLIIITIFFIFKFIFNISFSIKLILGYLTIILIGVISTILGINKKKS